MSNKLQYNLVIANRNLGFAARTDSNPENEKILKFQR